MVNLILVNHYQVSCVMQSAVERFFEMLLHYLGNSSRFLEYLPCYVNIENLCMLLSLSATFIFGRCKCSATFVL